MCFFFFNDTATTEIYTLSLHDALPISLRARRGGEGARSLRAARRVARRGAHHRGGEHEGRGRQVDRGREPRARAGRRGTPARRDRKSTRLNSSHLVISYAVFCLKKKKN